MAKSIFECVVLAGSSLSPCDWSPCTQSRCVRRLDSARSGVTCQGACGDVKNGLKHVKSPKFVLPPAARPPAALPRKSAKSRISSTHRGPLHLISEPLVAQAASGTSWPPYYLMSIVDVAGNAWVACSYLHVQLYTTSHLSGVVVVRLCICYALLVTCVCPYYLLFTMYLRPYVVHRLGSAYVRYIFIGKPPQTAKNSKGLRLVHLLGVSGHLTDSTPPARP